LPARTGREGGGHFLKSGKGQQRKNTVAHERRQKNAKTCLEKMPALTGSDRGGRTLTLKKKRDALQSSAEFSASSEEGTAKKRRCKPPPSLKKKGSRVLPGLKKKSLKNHPGKKRHFTPQNTSSPQKDGKSRTSGREPRGIQGEEKKKGPILGASRTTLDRKRKITLHQRQQP